MGVLVVIRNMVFGVIAVGVAALFLGLFTGTGGDSWTPRAYVPANGECFVPPQGDPLYDEHYAQQVNPFNCNALKVQSQSKFIDAQTEAVQVTTTQNQLTLYGFLGLLAMVAVFFVYALTKGDKAQG